MLSPSADRLYYALQRHPMMETIRTLERLILATGEEAIHLYESDDASANGRLFNHFLNTTSGDRILRDRILCANHQNNLLEGSLVSCTHGSLISDLFSVTHFLQAGSHFAKLKLAIRHYIEEHAQIRSFVNQCLVYVSTRI